MRFYFLLFTFLTTAPSGFSQKGKTKDWQLSIQTWTFHQYSLLESIHKADSLGVKNLEVYPGQKVGGDIAGPFSYNLGTEDRERIKELLKVMGMKILALGVIDKDYYNKDNLEKFFAFASYMGIPFITAEPEWEDLDQFNRLAATYHVKVALHCHPKPTSHYGHPDSTLKAMKGRNNIGAWPDIGHWARNGVPVVQALKKMEGKLWGLHLKDVREFDNVKTEDVLFGRGVCDLPGVIKELKRQRFKGVISMEYEANEYNNMEDMKRNKKYYDEQVRRN